MGKDQSQEEAWIEELESVDVSSWVVDELGSVDLGDQRLNRRLIETAAQMAGQPSAPLNQACGDWAATKGGYRMFKNKSAASEKIFAPHQGQTQGRMAYHELVLAVQDSTYVDYSTHRKTKGLGPIGTSKQDLWGLVQHSTLALTPTGLPLGILTQEIWARDPDAPEMSDYERTKRPIEEKESYKWITALRETVHLTPAGVQVVSVCDREADVYELFVEAEQLATGLLVRATQDRKLLDDETGKVWAAATAAPVSGHLQVQVPAKQDEPERKAVVEVRFCRVTLNPPWRPNREGQQPLPPITLDVILVQEVDAPDDVTPLEWLLLTNVPVENFEDAVTRVRWYRCRWHIEVYFKVLKSGCRIEDCRLGTAERLIRFIALSSIIAWRMYWVTHINRHAPEASCVVVLAEHEWHALYATIHRTTQLPTEPPTVGQVVRWIAQLGGFLARKGDGDPGCTAIWRGWQRLHDISTTWLIAHKDSYG
jgi:hypothetical protein